jgi:hypothetical protein
MFSERITKAQEVKKRLMAQTFVPIQSVEQHVAKLQQSTAAYFPTLLEQPNEINKFDPNRLKNWATVGVLAADPLERTSAKNTKYSLLKITNLIDVQFNVLLFGKTHEAWATRLRRGMLVGIQQPKILRPTEVSSVTNRVLNYPLRLTCSCPSKDRHNYRLTCRSGQQYIHYRLEQRLCRM